MITATEFYKASLAKQREILESRIKEAKNTGDPIIRLPFDTYPVVEEEMEELGWEYDSYNDKETGQRNAMFFPKQYNYDYTE